jgi:Predicted integral membrane protein
MLTRPVDAVTAMAASLEAVYKNPKPMALWAALIAGFVAFGIATLSVGLIVVFPLIGHATWHAFRSLVVDAQ